MRGIFIFPERQYTLSTGKPAFVANLMQWSLAEVNPEGVADPIISYRFAVHRTEERFAKRSELCQYSTIVVFCWSYMDN